MGSSLGLPLIPQLQRQGAAGGSSCEVSVGMRGRVWGSLGRPDGQTQSPAAPCRLLATSFPRSTPWKLRTRQGSWWPRSGLGAWHRCSAPSPALPARALFPLCLSAGRIVAARPSSFLLYSPRCHAALHRADCRPERPRSSCIPILLHCRATPCPTPRHPRSLVQYQEAPRQGVGRSRHLGSAGNGVGGGRLDGSRLHLGARNQSNLTLP